MDTTKKMKLEPTNVCIVCEFVDVFLEDSPRLLPDWEIEFKIEVLPVTVVILKAPYQIATIELRELKTQL